MRGEPPQDTAVGVVPPGTWRPPRYGGYLGYQGPKGESLPATPKGRAGTSPEPGSGRAS